ncbi:WD40-repeat-containing domain protein [Xylariales sp. AK1849]|nr:WD40-repeat-containing domain protein [Xylariales sp. AK1849]
MWKRLREKAKSASDPSIQSQASSPPPETSITPVPYLSTPDLPSPTDRRRSSSALYNIKERQLGPPRRGSEKSDLSDIQGQLAVVTQPGSLHRRQRSEERRDDPQGLTVLHSPEKERVVDILFIHGLGGTSRRTWSRNRDLDFLWPQLWLPNEPDFARARILSFGYNAHYASTKHHAALTISDFANDLLFRMKYGEGGTERMGQVPIIVVAHSMGGLVFKKAFIQGQLNEEYRSITASIKSVLFLATPHRGTDLAETLNKILSSSIFGHSSKDYIHELARSSPTIDELNESFRHHAGKLRIFSFYETLRTSIGLTSMMVLEKNSSVLGYPNETSQPLTANHHEVCKFHSPEDPNYKSVVGALRNVVQTFGDGTGQESRNFQEDIDNIRRLLAVSGAPEDDAAMLRALRKPGTCEHLFQHDHFIEWLQGPAVRSRILWINAPPGSGKSIQGSLIIDRLLESEGAQCSYYFFKYGDVLKRSLSHMFRSIAYQMALQIPSFMEALADMAKSGMRLEKADGQAVWRTIFKGVLANISLPPHLFWVVDGVDESESSRMFVDIVSDMGSFKGAIRVVILSRPLSNLTQAFQRARRSIDVASLALPGNLKDIERVAKEEIEILIPDDAFSQDTVQDITTRSEGNFLWASLVIDRISRCHRQEDVKKVLESTPTGMEQLYERMVDTVSNLRLDEEIPLAKILLSWATYAKRPLTVEELQELYASQLGSVMDLKHTATEVCGQLVVIDSHNQVTLVHHTAREYLRKAKKLPFPFTPAIIHEDLFMRCFGLLLTRNLRTRITQRKVPRFLSYATVAWIFHLEMCSVDSEKLLDTLVKFFSSPSVLSWIQYLAMSGQLFELVSASKALNTFIRKRRKSDANKTPLLHRLTDLSLLETWAIDLLKMTAKFGSHLLEEPTVIYSCVAPLAPSSSNLYQKFAGTSSSAASTISVSGLTNVEWDDCLARVSTGSSQAMQFAISAEFLAVADDSPQGRIVLWNSTIFQEIHTFHALEPVFSLCFNPSGTFLACYSMTMTRIWKVSDGSLLATFDNPHRARAIAMEFTSDNGIVVATDLRTIHRLSFDDEEPAWIAFDESLLEEAALPEGAFINSPSSVAFSSDNKQIAVAYRGFPLTVWSLDPPVMAARCRRRTKQGQTNNNMWTGVNRVCWHPFSGHVLGIYRDGNVFKWLPGLSGLDTHEEVKSELDATPHDLVCSPNGLVFATSDVKGAVKLYDFNQMSLIYKLTSEDIIKEICFSPDSRRFYDIRGSYCNIWEPNCLIRLVDANTEMRDDESIGGSDWDNDVWSETEDSRSASISLAASETHAESKPAITAVTPSPSASLFAWGNDEGILGLHDSLKNSRHIIAQSSFGMGIGHIAWSEDQKYLAYSLLNGRITVKSIELVAIAKNPKQALKTKNILAEKGQTKRGAPQQLLFDSTTQFLLTAGTEKYQVLAIPSGEVICECDTNKDEAVKWMLHPTDKDVIMAVSSRNITGYLWASLQVQFELPLDLSGGTSDMKPKSSITIENLQQSHHAKTLLVTISSEVANRRRHGFLLLDIRILQEPRDKWPRETRIQPISVPSVIASSVEHPVGLLSDGRLVFLNQNLWVCTAQVLGEADTAVTKHFFVPRDWVNAASLKLCQVLADGSLLCPSKGELAIIKSDLGSTW